MYGSLEQRKHGPVDDTSQLPFSKPFRAPEHGADEPWPPRLANPARSRIAATMLLFGSCLLMGALGATYYTKTDRVGSVVVSEATSLASISPAGEAAFQGALGGSIAGASLAERVGPAETGLAGAVAASATAGDATRGPPSNLPASGANQMPTDTLAAADAAAIAAAAAAAVAAAAATPSGPRSEDASTAGATATAGVLAALASAAAPEAASGLPAPALPHIILIMVDDMGYNDVGFAGDDFAGMTPNIDALAASGVKLERYYTQQLCTPARAALLTGRYPFRTGMQCDVVQPTEAWGLPTEYTILPEALSSAGYATHAVGKWHLGHGTSALLPHNRGFDSFYGFLCDHTYYDTHENPEYEVLDFTSAVAGDAAGECVDLYGDYSVTLHMNRTLDILEAHSADQNLADTPLFLYLAIPAPHYPLQYDDDIDYTPVQGVLEAMEKGAADGVKRQKVGRMMYGIDLQIGRLIEGLSAGGYLRNYVLAFMSDNGGCPTNGQSNYPLRGSKHYLFEGGSRGRAFLTGSSLPASAVGSEYSGLFHVTDWLPTLLQAVEDVGAERESISTTAAVQLDDNGSVNSDAAAQLEAEGLVNTDAAAAAAVAGRHERQRRERRRRLQKADSSGGGAGPQKGTSSAKSGSTIGVTNAADAPYRGATANSFFASTTGSTSGVDDVDGVSHWGKLTGLDSSTSMVRNEIVYNIEFVKDGSNSYRAALRSGQWKLILNEHCQVWDDFYGRYSDAQYDEQCTDASTSCGGSTSTDIRTYLFDLESDPNETTDLADTYPEKVSELHTRIKELELSYQASVWTGKDTQATVLSAWAAHGCITPWDDA